MILLQPLAFLIGFSLIPIAVIVHSKIKQHVLHAKRRNSDSSRDHFGYGSPLSPIEKTILNQQSK